MSARTATRTANRTERLSTGFSLYCDVLRFCASLTVLLVHAGFARLSGGMLWQVGRWGHPAVIVFFVLSGFIIAFVSSTRETGLAEYSAARLARLYSVVIPAIALAWGLDRIGMAHNPALYDAGRETMPLWRATAAALFLSQSWYREVALFCNSAWWSLPYEFWYYVLFGAAMFLAGKARIIALVLAALIAGPNILLMFPVWLFGVAAYRRSLSHPAGKTAGLLFAVSLAVTGLGIACRLKGWLAVYDDTPYLPFSFSLADYIIGLGIALNLHAASGLAFGLLTRFKSIIRGAAGMTFSLYLFNLPIMFCVAAFLPPLPGLVRYAILLSTALSGSWLLSLVTENRKGVLRDGFLALFRGRARSSAKAAL